MDCVLILFQRRLDLVTQDPEKMAVKPSWQESLKMMTEAGFLNNLQNFNKDSINDEVRSVCFLIKFNVGSFRVAYIKKYCLLLFDLKKSMTRLNIGSD